MQITKIITTVVATACISTAIPTAHENDQNHGVERPKGDDKYSVDGNMQCKGGDLYCCDSDVKGLISLGLDCLLQNVLSGGCANTQICCTQNGDGSKQTCSSQNGLVNIQ